MALKKAIATFTKENGETVTRQFSIHSVVFKYAEQAIEVIYVSFPNEAARDRGAAPEYISQRIPVDMTNPTDISMILSVSDRIWEMAAVNPFITDYTEVDQETGLQVKNVKSLNDLTATIQDVPF